MKDSYLLLPVFCSTDCHNLLDEPRPHTMSFLPPFCTLDTTQRHASVGAGTDDSCPLAGVSKKKPTSHSLRRSSLHETESSQTWRGTSQHPINSRFRQNRLQPTRSRREETGSRLARSGARGGLVVLQMPAVRRRPRRWVEGRAESAAAFTRYASHPSLRRFLCRRSALPATRSIPRYRLGTSPSLLVTLFPSRPLQQHLPRRETTTTTPTILHCFPARAVTFLVQISHRSKAGLCPPAHPSLPDFGKPTAPSL